MTKQIRPWKNWQTKRPEQMPDAGTLRKWRVRARALAKAKGFHTSCDLCKRPIAKPHRHGRVGLRNAKAWRSPQKVRIICHSCYLILSSTIDEMERLGARDHLPPEDYADVSTKKLAQIDAQSEEEN